MKVKWIRAAAAAACLSFAVPTAAFAQETAVSASQEELDRLRSALEQTGSMISFDWTADLSSQYSGYGLTITFDQQSRIQVSGGGTGEMTALRTDRETALGETEETVSFYTGGYYYGEDYGFPMKSQITPEAVLSAMTEDILAVSGTVVYDNLAADFPPPSVEQMGEETVYTYVADPEFLAEFSADSEETYTVFAVQLYVGPDRYVNREKRELRNTDPEGYELVVYMDNRLNNPGQPVSISLPSTAGYEEW